MTERLTDEMLAAYLAVAEDKTDYAVQFRRPDLVLILTELRQRRAAEQQAGRGPEAAWASYDKRRSDYLDEHPEAGTYDLIQDGGCSSFHAGYKAASQGSARVVEANHWGNPWQTLDERKTWAPLIEALTPEGLRDLDQRAKASSDGWAREWRILYRAFLDATRWGSIAEEQNDALVVDFQNAQRVVEAARRVVTMRTVVGTTERFDTDPFGEDARAWDALTAALAEVSSGS